MLHVLVAARRAAVDCGERRRETYLSGSKSTKENKWTKAKCGSLAPKLVVLRVRSIRSRRDGLSWRRHRHGVNLPCEMVSRRPKRVVTRFGGRGLDVGPWLALAVTARGYTRRSSHRDSDARFMDWPTAIVIFDGVSRGFRHKTT